MDPELKAYGIKPVELKNVSQIASEYSDTTTPRELSSEQPLNQFSVLLPVAAHQEAGTIYHALSQYAAQTNCDPFSVVLNLNHPEGADQPSIDATYSELTRARQDFPELHIATLQTVNPPGTTIGNIRRDLWDAALAAGLADGTLRKDQDMFGLNHDIDVIKLPEQYMRTVQEHYKKDTQRRLSRYALLGLEPGVVTSLRPVMTRMKHAASPATPNISKATTWHDAVLRIYGGGYEASAVLPLSFYAEAGGFNTNDHQGELLNLLSRGGNSPSRVIATPLVETSPRRLTERLSRGKKIHQIWEPDSFSDNNTYRDHPVASDITTPHLHDLVADFAENKDRLAYTLLNYAHRQSTKRSLSASCDDLANYDHAASLDHYLGHARRLAHFALSHQVGYPEPQQLLDEAIQKGREILTKLSNTTPDITVTLRAEEL